MSPQYLQQFRSFDLTKETIFPIRVSVNYCHKRREAL